MGRGREKVAAFYEEFPCLRRVVRPSRVETIYVHRVDRGFATTDEHGRFFLFDNHRRFICRSEISENMEEAIMGVGGQDRVGLVVEKRFPQGSAYIPGWFSFLVDFLSGERYILTIYQMPYDFRIDNLRPERVNQAVRDVKKEIKKA